MQLPISFKPGDQGVQSLEDGFIYKQFVLCTRLCHVPMRFSKTGLARHFPVVLGNLDDPINMSPIVVIKFKGSPRIHVQVYIQVQNKIRVVTILNEMLKRLPIVEVVTQGVFPLGFVQRCRWRAGRHVVTKGWKRPRSRAWLHPIYIQARYVQRDRVGEHTMGRYGRKRVQRDRLAARHAEP